MSSMVNPELMRMMLEKIAVVPSDAAMMAGGGDAMPVGGQAPDPSQLGVQGAAQPVDPATAAMGAAPPQGGVDPSQDPTGAAAMAQPPAPMPAPAPAPAAQAQQKLKPEQMMQMIDFRMYNMQQILTAIASALGVQIDPSVLVMPPGTTGAPPAEAALPGGPMAPAPQPQDPNAAGGPVPPGGPLPPGGPMDPSQPPMDPAAAKQAWWAKPVAKFVESNGDEPTPTQLKAAAVSAILRSRSR